MGHWNKRVELKELEGKVIKSITGLIEGSEEVRVFTECGNEYLFYHEQGCCEDVHLNDFEGVAEDLIGGVIVSAEERSNSGDEDSKDKPSEYSDSFTWTFYDIQTTKGSIWMRWLGESNGYYSESVDLAWINKPD